MAIADFTWPVGYVCMPHTFYTLTKTIPNHTHPASQTHTHTLNTKITESPNGLDIIMFQQNPYNFERMFVIYRFRLLLSTPYNMESIWQCIYCVCCTRCEWVFDMSSFLATRACAPPPNLYFPQKCENVAYFGTCMWVFFFFFFFLRIVVIV